MTPSGAAVRFPNLVLIGAQAWSAASCFENADPPDDGDSLERRQFSRWGPLTGTARQRRANTYLLHAGVSRNPASMKRPDRGETPRDLMARCLERRSPDRHARRSEPRTAQLHPGQMALAGAVTPSVRAAVTRFARRRRAVPVWRPALQAVPVIGHGCIYTATGRRSQRSPSSGGENAS